jgi:hypothetical protein
MGYGLWVIGYRKWVRGYGLWVIEYGLGVMGYGLWVKEINYHPQVSNL